MATNYPTSLDNGTSLPYPSATDDTNSPSLSSGQDNQNDALIAVETLLGNNTTQTTPTAQYNVLQADSATSNVWGKITSNNVSSSTGSGDFVFATSPTISSPTISSPTISSPTITGSLGNISTGTITASGATTLNSTLSVSGATTLTGAVTANGGLTVSSSFSATGLVTFADLLSTIFSGQLQTYTTNSVTGQYANIGGLKFCFIPPIETSGLGANSSVLIGFNLPTGFFTNFLYYSANTTGVTNSTNQYSYMAVLSASASNGSFYVVNFSSSTVTNYTNIIVIGT